MIDSEQIFSNVTLSLFLDRNTKADKAVFSDVLSDKTLQKRYRYLECAHQNITAFPTDAIANLTHLKQIVFDHTNTSAIQTNAFSNLPKLKSMKITNNPLQRLPENAFNCSALLVLNLSSNALDSLHENALMAVPKLRQLDLSENRLKTIEPALFANTPLLYDLHFSKNRLREIPEGAFKYLKGPSGVNITILLDYNEITNFSALAFGNNVKLDYLLLTGNEIEFFDVLQNVGSVEWLELSENNIECLDYELMEKVVVLMADENPWSCECLKSFWEKRRINGLVFFANAELSRCLLTQTYE